MFTDMGEQSDFTLYKYFHCYLMDRLCESLPTWVNKAVLCFISTLGKQSGFVLYKYFG